MMFFSITANLFFIQNDSARSLELRSLKTSFADPLENKRYHFLGFSNYTPNHYTAVCYLPNSTWCEIDDMTGNITMNLNPTAKKTPSCLLYIRN